MLGSHRALGHGVVQRVLGDSSVAVKGRESVIRYAEQDTSCNLGILSSPEDSGPTVVPLVPSYGGCFGQQRVSCSPRVLQLVSGQTSSGSGRIFCGPVASKGLCLSTSSSDISGTGEDQQGSVHGHLVHSRVEICSVVGSGQQHVAAGASQSRGLQGDPMVSQGGSDTIPPPPVGLLGGGEENSLLSNQAALLVDQDVRPATHKLYKSRFKIFSTYCEQYGYNPTSCPVEIVTNFLAMLQDTKRMQYRTICGYRSAIARYHRGIAGTPLGSAKLIKRLTKACFNQNPPLPKYSDIWDADALLGYLETMYPNSELSTYDLGLKSVPLLTVLSLSRQSSLAVLGKPYQGVVPATLAKWLLVCMDRAGICTASYRANSVRSAGASGLRAKGMSLSQVLARGNWSPTTRTFAIFYDRSGVDDQSGKILDI